MTSPEIGKEGSEHAVVLPITLIDIFSIAWGNKYGIETVNSSETGHLTSITVILPTGSELLFYPVPMPDRPIGVKSSLSHAQLFAEAVSNV